MVYKKILIAVDSSEYSMKAAEKGLALAQQLEAEVALVFVIEAALASGNIDAGITPDEALIVLKKEAEQTLTALTDTVAEKTIMKFMPEGNPKEDILKTAENWKADLLVLGTHGRTGLMHLIMGSTAEHVMHHSNIPVLMVPSK